MSTRVRVYIHQQDGLAGEDDEEHDHPESVWKDRGTSFVRWLSSLLLLPLSILAHCCVVLDNNRNGCLLSRRTPTRWTMLYRLPNVFFLTHRQDNLHPKYSPFLSFEDFYVGSAGVGSKLSPFYCRPLFRSHLTSVPPVKIPPHRIFLFFSIFFFLSRICWCSPAGNVKQEIPSPRFVFTRKANKLNGSS